MFPKYTINDKIFNNRGDLFKHYVENNDFDLRKVKCSLNHFDNYTFKRNKDVDIFALAKERLLELKATGKKIHFWYSGGMDSHFPLYCMQKFNIWPDTINTYIVDPSDGTINDFIHFDEEKPSREYISNIAIPDNVELIHHNIGSKQFIDTILSEGFSTNSSMSKYSFIFATNYFHNTIKDFPLDDIHLKGSITPIVYYNHKKRKWQFRYYDYQFEGNPYSHITPFIDESPKFLEGYINSIINTLEEKHLKLGHKEMDLMISNTDRFLKKQCPEKVLACKDISWVQYGKRVATSYTSGIDIVDSILNTMQEKGHCIYVKSAEANLEWVKHYNESVKNIAEIINTDINFGGFPTEIITIN